MPKVSVLMPMYNSEKYIRKAIQSVLNQSFKDFELLILNDGSTDGSKAIALGYDDKRIKVLENESNQGLARTRNRLFAEASGEYIAWLDSDDIALPERLRVQVDFLDKHPQHAFVASWARIIDSEDEPTGNFIKSFIPNDYLFTLFLFVNYVVQSSVLLRKTMFPDTPYDLQFPPTEDYELWVRIAQKHLITILPMVLVDYRVHDSNISFTQNERASQTVQMNHQAQLKRLGIITDPTMIDLHYQIAFGNTEKITEEFIQKAEKWLLKIQEANNQTHIYDKKALRYILAHRWTKICTTNPKLGITGLKYIFKSKLSRVTLQNLGIIGQYLFKK